MSIKRFEALVKDEKTAYRHLKKLCRKYGHVFCPRCKGRDAYSLSNGKYRCKRCRYDFREFTGRWLSRVRLSPKQWIWLVKLFSLEISTRRMAKELEVHYSTALKAVDSIRMSIVMHSGDNLLKGIVEMDETYFGGRRKGKRGRGALHKMPVFGILERNGRVFVNVLPDVSADSILSIAVRKVKRGSIVYTDKWRSYDALMFCGYRHMKVDHDVRFSRGKVHINGMEGFWSYAKERLIKHHGVSPRKFPLYIKEMEFRYNNREGDVFDTLLNYITDLVAKDV